MTPVKPFLFYTILGLQQKLEESLHIDAPQLNTVSDISNLVFSKDADKQLTKYPISFFRITNMEISEEMNITRKSRRGTRFDVMQEQRTSAVSKNLRPIGKTDTNVPENEAVYSTKEIIMLPVKLSFELTFISNAYEHLLDFSTRWMFTSIYNRLNFIISYYGQDFNVSSVLDPNLSLPTKDSIFSDLPDYYLFQANFTTTSYITNSDDRDQRELPLIKTVHHNVKINN